MRSFVFNESDLMSIMKSLAVDWSVIATGLSIISFFERIIKIKSIICLSENAINLFIYLFSLNKNLFI